MEEEGTRPLFHLSRTNPTNFLPLFDLHTWRSYVKLICNSSCLNFGDVIKRRALTQWLSVRIQRKLHIFSDVVCCELQVVLGIFQENIKCVSGMLHRDSGYLWEFQGFCFQEFLGDGLDCLVTTTSDSNAEGAGCNAQPVQLLIHCIILYTFISCLI